MGFLCFGNICLGNLFQLLLFAFFGYRLVTGYLQHSSESSAVEEFRGNDAKRRRAEQVGAVSPKEDVSQLPGLKSVIERYATSGPSFLKRDQDRYILIKFSATWCGPCRQVAPFVDLLRYCYKFLLVNVDIDSAAPELKRVATAVPTFVLLKLQKNDGPVSGLDFLGMKVVSKLTGGSPGPVENLLRTHCTKFEKLPM
ncbi:thioredoxin [Gregarina niphandrodes]|uniref:Thioredoxin n=1 Tax=Gregarina niphandrodes TaxID=110365 RepID=A0A023AXZ3_GRENI|nr:thioredoxin [Gregarina niphandrodes]EZG43519.1 thioredoxin [Gregarina niphandrodes]|eukprot:XP_011133252.1 thioredoxin [Gregarina niphandrodes]